MTLSHPKLLKHYNTPGHAHELTFSCYRRRNYLTDSVACELFVQNLAYVRTQFSLRLWAYVLMPNHVHLLIWPRPASYDMGALLASLKGRMSKAYRDHLVDVCPERALEFMVPDKRKTRKVFRFWQPGGGFDRNLWNVHATHHAIGYIEGNPVRRGLAVDPAAYRWSSAYARAHGEGAVPDGLGVPVLLTNAQRQRVGLV